MANLQGKNDILFIHDGTAYLPIGCLTTNGINISREVTEGTRTKCDTNPEGVPQDATYEVTFEAIAQDDNTGKASYDILKAEIEGDAATYWKIERDGTPIQFGRAYLTSLETSAPVDGEITYSGNLQGIGNISETDLMV